MVDMRGKTVLITGGTSGLGYETARQLAALGSRIIISGRNLTTGHEAVNKIAAETGNTQVDFIQSDFTLFDSVQSMAMTIKNQFDRIDVFINNAGFITNKHFLTPDGIESQWSVNYFSAFLLTHLLLEMLKNSEAARIVNVSAAAHEWVKFNSFHFQSQKGNYNGKNVYAATKLALTMFTYELARRLQNTNITVNCLHPGIVRTNFKAEVIAPPAFLFKYFFLKPSVGAKTMVYLASDESVNNTSGRYFEKCKPVGTSMDSNNQELCKKLWADSVNILAGYI
jgi:retinol dehydrogenase 12